MGISYFPISSTVRRKHVFRPMVISHGSGGILADREPMWAERLRKQGVATFLVDSFAPRGIASTGADQSRLPLAASIADALHALQLLSTHPRIDPTRIGIIGFSKGGQVALYTALEPFREAVMGKDGERFALHIALYASCSIPYKGAPVSDAPILLLLGGADDYTPSAHCGRYANWLREHGGNVDLNVIKGGHHGFDLVDASALPTSCAKRPRLRYGYPAKPCGRGTLGQRAGASGRGNRQLSARLHAKRRYRRRQSCGTRASGR